MLFHTGVFVMTSVWYSEPGADEPYCKNIYFVDLAGFEVKFVEYLSDIPAERNLNQEKARKEAV